MLGTGLVIGGSLPCQKRLFLGSSIDDLGVRLWDFGAVAWDLSYTLDMAVWESENSLHHCLMVLVWGSPYPGRLPMSLT